MSIVIGTMRLSTDVDRDEAAALRVLERAIAAGARCFDTACAYGHGDGDRGHNERLVRRAIEASGVDPVSIRVITKCGMSRPEGRWVPDGRRRAILADAEASCEALGRPPDVLLLHAVDPRVPLSASARALSEAAERGFAMKVGLANVSRAELDAASALVPVSAVELSLGAFDDEAARSGLVRHAIERGLEVFAYAPFGGPRRSGRIARDRVLVEIGARHGVSPHGVLLAYLQTLHSRIAVVVGPRREATVVDALSAGELELDADDLARLDERFEGLTTIRRQAARPTAGSVPTSEVTLVMGIAGSGKSTYAERLIADAEARGEAAIRLNRDAIGGTLRGIARRLEEHLRDGARRVVLDNTYLGAADRADVVRIGHSRGARVLCVHLELKVEDALHNVALRMLRRYGRLLDPAEIASFAKKDPGLMRPTAVYRMARELEPPLDHEGFDALETIAFERAEDPHHDGALVVPLEALVDVQSGTPLAEDAVRDAIAKTSRESHVLVIGFRPDGAIDAWREAMEARIQELAERLGRCIELGVCTHGGGPPTCYCRPPLPGLFLDFARRHRISAPASTMLVRTPTQRAMATNLGMRIV